MNLRHTKNGAIFWATLYTQFSLLIKHIYEMVSYSTRQRTDIFFVHENNTAIQYVIRLYY